METELRIEGSSFAPLSARGCVQTLALVPHGFFKRTISGQLCYVGKKLNKYKSTIYCEDKVSLVNEGVFMRGNKVRIGCIQRLWQEAEAAVVALERPFVEGSLCVMDQNRQEMAFGVASATQINIEGHQDYVRDRLYVSYRPWLWMAVIDLQLRTDEWGLKCGWRVELEEI